MPATRRRARGSPALWCAASALALVLSPPAGASDAEPARASASWLVPALSYDGAALANVHGGLRTGGAYVGNLHLKLTTRDDAIGWPGTSPFLAVPPIPGGQPRRPGRG